MIFFFQYVFKLWGSFPADLVDDKGFDCFQKQLNKLVGKKRFPSRAIKGKDTILRGLGAERVWPLCICALSLMLVSKTFITWKWQQADLGGGESFCPSPPVLVFFGRNSG